MAENLVERALREKTPLIDGQTVTFVWQGAANAPRLIADFNKWEHEGGSELKPVAEGVWALSVMLPLDAYVEYVFQDGKERVRDPFNPRRITNGIGSMNHFFYMPDAKPAGYTRPDRQAARGTVTSENLKAEGLVVGGRRRVHFYQPPCDEACPLLLVWDGQDYLRRARLATIIDNLIHQGRIRPIAMAMPEHRPQSRLLEYGCAEITLGFVEECVLPQARQRLNLLDPASEPGAFGVIGASMGGLMALYSGLRLPHIFGRVLSQSGAFSFPNHDFIVWDMIKWIDPARLKIWMDVGTHEWLIDTNRRMKAALEALRFDFVYREYHGGHNYTSWQNELGAGLEFLFPPITP